MRFKFHPQFLSTQAEALAVRINFLSRVGGEIVRIPLLGLVSIASPISMKSFAIDSLWQIHHCHSVINSFLDLTTAIKLRFEFRNASCRD
jgi:hypothetical protein